MYTFYIKVKIIKIIHYDIKENCLGRLKKKEANILNYSRKNVRL